MSAANPQGKGLVPVLDQWHASQPTEARHRDARRLLADYFSALLVLSAEFNFKPVMHTPYYLYRDDARWLLSLIAPSEWQANQPGAFVGRCELQTDMSWSFIPSADLATQPAVIAALESFKTGFATLLDQDGKLEDNLPFFVNDLPYYRRLMAAGLASSLQQSLAVSGLEGVSSREWLTSTPLPRLTF